MIKSYIKTAWRSLLKNKVFSLINVLGLSIGLAAFILIINYLRFEYSFDDFNKNKDLIYRVPMTITETGGTPQNFAFTFPALGPAMRKDFPEVQDAIRFRKQWGIVRHGDQKIIEDDQIYFVDTSMFNVFSFEFEKGSASTAFSQLNDAVITHSTAIKYFGASNPIGQSLHYNDEDYVVSAVLKDLPSNSHLQFHILLNYNKYIQITHGDANTRWNWSDFYTYLLLKPGTNAAALQAKLPAFVHRYLGDDMKKSGYGVDLWLQPLKEIHTHSKFDYEMAGSGNLYYLKYLGIAAALILLIAFINYVNLSTAQSLERSKEVGVRKAIGASKLQLIRQFLSESFMMNMVGILIGVFLFKWLLPQFSLLIGQNVTDLQTQSFKFWGIVFGVFLLGTMLAGFYPAFILSSFRPIQSIRVATGLGTQNRGSNIFRKFFVVVQFSAAILLITGALGFYRQLQFMNGRNLGVDIRQTLVLKQTNNLDSGKQSVVESFINNLRSIPGVQAVTASTDVPGNEVGGSSDYRLVSSTSFKRCREFGINEKFVPNFGLTLVAGRNFDKDSPVTSDTTQIVNIIINESTAKVFGFVSMNDAINKIVQGPGHPCKIIGVLQDYHQQSLKYNFDPIVFYPEQLVYMSSFSIKFSTAAMQSVLAEAKRDWIASFPDSPFQFFFLDDHFNEQYKNDRLFSTILWWFTFLAIVVASLGLFGLSLYTVTKRSKEISLRKVLGATVPQIIALISKDYLKLVLLAGVIAIPSAYFILKNWLNGYAFHIHISLLLLLAPLVLIAIIAILTVLVQSIKAAIANPVKSLRTE